MIDIRITTLITVTLSSSLFDCLRDFAIETIRASQECKSRKVVLISLLTWCCLFVAVSLPTANGSGYCASPVTVYERSLSLKNIPGLSASKYPQFKGMQNQSKLNAMVKAKVEAEVKSFSSENKLENYAVSYDVTTVSKKFLSLVVKFTNLDTNAIERYTCINLATTDPKPITVDYLIDKGFKSRDVFLILVLEAFSKKNKDFNSALLVEELFAEPKYLQNFSISQQSITFYFNSGAIAADALGSQKIVVPISRVSQLIGNSFPLSQVYKSKRKGSLDSSDAIRTERDLCNVAVRTYTRLIQKGEEHPELYEQRSRWYKKLGLKTLADRDQALKEKCGEPTEPENSSRVKPVAPETTSSAKHRR